MKDINETDGESVDPTISPIFHSNIKARSVSKLIMEHLSINSAYVSVFQVIVVLPGCLILHLLLVVTN